MSEKQIESYLVREVHKRGGIAYKFTSPGNPGVPDRLILLPDGRTIYVELKTEFGQLSKLQHWQIGRMRELGAVVYTLKSIEQIKNFIKEVFGDAVQTA